MKINLKPYLKKIDSHFVNEIADEVADHLNDEEIDFDDDASAAINYLCKKASLKPFTKEEIEKLMKPIIHLVVMNQFHEYASTLQDTVNEKFDIALDCDFPTFDGDDYSMCQSGVAEALIEHLA